MQILHAIFEALFFVAIYGIPSLIVWFFATGLWQGFLQMWREQRDYKTKMEVYRENGGKPWVNPNLATCPVWWENRAASLPDPKAWAEQDEINRKARQIAGLPE